MPIASGTKLGPYEIIALLGAGGMGEVYRARDTRLGRDVAVKMLTSMVANDKEQIARFAQEARAAGMLNHPNLLTLFDLGTANGAPFIISELLEGETLRERLNLGPVNFRKIVDYALQISNGLAAAHDKGIVHRDLKPENVFVTRDDRVKILDFGIAKLLPQQEGPGSFQVAATTPGMVLGTVGYMSPEQVRGENVDQRSDIFSFGAILYEMLSGRRAFRRDSSIETLSAILKEEPPELTDLNVQVSPPLDRVVRRCLEKNRERRFQSARDLAFHLESIGTHSSVSQPSPVFLPGPGSVAAPAPLPTQERPPESSPDAPTTRMPTAAGATPLPATAQRKSTVATKATAAVRPPAPSFAAKKRHISTVLLWALAIVSILGALYGGYRYALAERGAVTEPDFQRLTFRRGEVRGARFSPDGEMVVYAAAWEGHRPELFIASRQNPESRAIGIANAEIAAISKSAELAVILNRNRHSGVGTLARVPMVGGTPREVADSVVQADWSPDGTVLAAIRIEGGAYRVESPVGTARYDSPRALSELRFSPDGSRLAFLEQRGGGVDVVILPTNGSAAALAHGWSHGAQGLAWSPNGEEIWVSGTDSNAPPALHAVNMNGEVRVVQKLTGSVRLNDIAPSGRALLTHGSWRSAMMVGKEGMAERDNAWFDWSILADLSADGTKILFNETREGGGDKGSIYLRPADGGPPVRIGDGYGDAISPDGKWALCHRDGKLVLIPTGTGEMREVKSAGVFDLGAIWLPDNRRVVVAGVLPQHGFALHVVDTSSGAVKTISAEGIPGDVMRAFSASHDGRFVAGLSKENRIVLYPVDGGAAIPVAGVEAGEIPLQWSADGTMLYVYSPTEVPARIFRVTLATGARELWKEFSSFDAAGVYRIAPVAITPDGATYAYNALRILSDLYIMEWPEKP